MVVADEDPPRKRSRLSLKASKKGENLSPADEPPTLESAGATPQGPTLPVETEPVTDDCPPPLIDLTQSDLPSDSCSVPPVASLENLGNTCFLNSVLEVLRYTPCFLDGLGELYRHIVYIENVKATAAEQSAPEVKAEPKLSWELVKNLFKMYKRMEQREQMFFQYASADVTSMAVKPDKILDNIREFNPMFEGNMQHDAQELMRCLLCYLEDAERELHADYAQLWALDPALLKTPVKESAISLESEKQTRSAMKTRRRLLSEDQSTDPSCSDSLDVASVDQPDSTKSDAASAVTVNGDILDEIDSETRDSKRKIDPASYARSKKRKFRSARAKKLCEEASSGLDEVDGFVQSNTAVDSLQGGSWLERDGGGAEECGSTARTRRSTRRGKADASTSSAASSNGDGNDVPTSSIHCTPCREQQTKPLVQRDCAHTPKSLDKNQPTILSMLSKKGPQCRRLGMRGRVVCRDQNGGTESQGAAAETREVSPSTGNGISVTAEISPMKQNGGTVNGGGRQNGGESQLLPDADSLFGANLASGSSRLARSPLRRSPRKSAGTSSSAQRPDMNGSASLSRITNSGDAPSSSSPHPSPARPSHTVLNDSIDTRLTPPPSPSVSKVSKALTFSPADKEPPSPCKASKMTPIQDLCTKTSGLGLVQPKLMIKLEKCDRLCVSPTVSASAAMKALKTSSSAVRKVTFGPDQRPEKEELSDTEEEEGTLGQKASFQSVPLKSVSVKVEKCDMVCSSPEKSVSARFATSCLARQRAQRFNIIEKLFQGSMMMRTKCLECENCTERRESFQDVSVPLKEKGSSGSDSELDEDHDSSLLRLMQAFTEVERLQDDNKYFCDHCVRKNEAERSLHYDILPNILTVHLKRFSASTGMFGCLSKINDRVTVPLLLSCLRYKCPKPCVRPDHRYTLFAIITHAGSTISSGHYLSYIKVRPNADGSPLGYDTLAAYLNSPSKNSQNDTSLSEGQTADSDVKMETESESRDHVVPSPSSSSGNSGKRKLNGEKEKDKKTDGEATLDPDPDSSLDSDPDSLDYYWLECDDETIHILSQKEFQMRLTDKEGSLRGTPYVLFYHRLDKWRGK